MSSRGTKETILLINSAQVFLSSSWPSLKSLKNCFVRLDAEVLVRDKVALWIYFSSMTMSYVVSPSRTIRSLQLRKSTLICSRSPSTYFLMFWTSVILKLFLRHFIWALVMWDWDGERMVAYPHTSWSLKHKDGTWCMFNALLTTAVYDTV